MVFSILSHACLGGFRTHGGSNLKLVGLFRLFHGTSQSKIDDLGVPRLRKPPFIIIYPLSKFPLDGQELGIEGSWGASFAPIDGISPDEIWDEIGLIYGYIYIDDIHMNSKTTDPISPGPHIQVPYLSETTPFVLQQASRDVLSRILTTLLRHLTPRIIPRSSWSTWSTGQ